MGCAAQSQPKIKGCNMRKTIWLAVLASVAVGCTVVDENPDWNPRDLPEWAYDKPFYYRPSEDMKPTETVGPGIPVYYTRQQYFFLKHPVGYQVSGAPRMAVWCTSDGGKNWEKQGYYGVEQTHFLMRAEQDGQYRIRFVGPSQGAMDVPPGMPHRIYVVDREPPRIVLTVTPAPWKDKEKKERYIYKVNETVTVRWYVSDVNLKKDSIKLGTCFAEFPHNLIWREIPEPMAPRGSVQMVIPPEAVRDGGMRFRMEATDKAGNVGLAMTEIMRVAGKVPLKPTTRPGHFKPVPAKPLIKEARPGWPTVGCLIRGKTKRVLGWMPPEAKKYPKLELEFSDNNGLSWHVMATNIKFGQKVPWIVPAATSKQCRIRIVGITADGKRVMVVTSQPFTVDTVRPDLEMGPKPLPPK